jgi:hypothetical protein
LAESSGDIFDRQFFCRREAMVIKSNADLAWSHIRPTSLRSNSESTLLHGEDDSLNPILSVEPFHRLLDVPIDGSV